MANQRGSQSWKRDLQRWLAPFLAVLGHPARRRWAPVYLLGLLGPGERKSVRPLAARVAPTDGEQLHHFVAASRWDTSPLELVLAREAQRLVGGPDAVLIVDDTALPKRGRGSVGVAHQYCGVLGKQATCQALVSLTLARDEVPVPVALRLFLPAEWTRDPLRCRRVQVPAARLPYRSKAQIALEELDRLRAAGVTFGAVVADAGYGKGAAFRHALSARGLTWAVGVLGTQKVYPLDVRLQAPARQPRGRPPKHPVATAASRAAEHLLAALPSTAWSTLSWRCGTKGPLVARFAALRVRVADGPPNARGQHLPGEAVWLVGERRATGEHKYYLTNQPEGLPLGEVVATIKARWACEQAHQQLKGELGLDHFQGRSWPGLHHHALLAMIAFAFLQHLRLRQAVGTRTLAPTPPGPPPQPTLPAVRRALLTWLAPPRACARCAAARRPNRQRWRARPSPRGRVAK
jgi:SRSO17 transposase